ncbi:MAG: radical SAM family heme chaperone HemW [Butyrivibrio sp.]|nr:radical SAM family heme chaperone HemW [Butyrivibrio sp.]
MSLGVYVHIPFCVRKCLYCDFLSFPAETSMMRTYFDALLREIRAVAPDLQHDTVDTVFLGGGTPSLPAAEFIPPLLSCIRTELHIDPGAEISMECNPGTVTEEKLSLYHDAGINRLSIGLQSAEDAELAVLGRIHSLEDFLRTYAQARTAGFDNINIDLMRGIPGQTRASFRRSLEQVCHLRPEHLSVYSLIIEDGTPFGDRYGTAQGRRAPEQGAAKQGTLPPLPSEEEELAMSADTEEVLAAAGYGRYEISNYARPGYACQHNLRYWRRADYIGFGLGAASLLGNGTQRFHNTNVLPRYLAEASDPSHIREDNETLSVRARMEETMFLGLRMTRGVSRTAFRAQFGVDLREVYDAVIRQNERDGLLTITPEYLCLTPRGLDISNYVMAQFLFDTEQATA